MHRSLLPRLAVVLCGLASACNDATVGVTLFQADLAAENEVPAAASSANGACGFQVEGSLVRYSIEVHHASGITGAHIRGAPAGQKGPIRVYLYPSTSIGSQGPASGPVDGVLIEGSFSPADVNSVSFDRLLGDMRAGATYCNIETDVAPSGLLRGQIRPLSVD